VDASVDASVDAAVDAAVDAMIADAGVPGVGDLIVTEIMHSPDGSDTTREWFEVHNTTGAALEMLGMTIEDDGIDTFTVGSSVVVEAGGYVVFGKSDDVIANDGVLVDYVFSTMFLSDDDSIILKQGGVEIDRVDYLEVGDWPNGTSRAASLDPASFDSTANDSGLNWCAATTPYGTNANRGTPGQPNPNCP
jgi:hypothetical protein